MTDLLTTIATDVAELKTKVSAGKTFYEAHVTAIVGVGCLLIGWLIGHVL